MKSIALIDGQNLYLGTTSNGWKVDLFRFRIYLKDKYKISEAYYFLGYYSDSEIDLYDNLSKAGFITRFKEHNIDSIAKKKGNVDSDIIFEVMKNLVEEKDMGKIILVSGDGDYKKLVDYLISKNKFKKILFPNKKFASSLYKLLTNEYCDFLDKPEIQRKLIWVKEKGALGN